MVTDRSMEDDLPGLGRLGVGEEPGGGGQVKPGRGNKVGGQQQP